MRYNKPRKKVSGLLACAVICSTAPLPQAQVYGAEIGEVKRVGEVTTSAALEIGPAQEERTTSQIISLNANDMAVETLVKNTSIGAFTLMSSETKPIVIEASSKIADDGTSYTQRIKLGGTGSFSERSIHFSTEGKATVEVYAMSGSSSEDRVLALYASDGTPIGEAQALGKTLQKGTIEIAEAGDYYLASPSSGVNVYAINVIMGEKGPEVERPSWEGVAGPVITGIDYKEAGSDTIEIQFDLETSLEAADKATVEVKDSEGNVVEEILVGKSNDIHKVAEFTPSSSGTYTFTVYAERNGEETAKASESKDFDYKLPLTASVVRATNKGKGDVLVKWTEVKEAESYQVAYKTADSEYVNGPLVSASDLEEGALLKGLEVGQTYAIRVTALRGEEFKHSEELAFAVEDKIEREWAFTYFGQSINSAVNTAEVVDKENLTIKLNSCSVNADGSINKKGGKFTTYHDGISYYYTEVNPKEENFVLTATFTVDYINPTLDGQEGFGIIAMDRLGEHGVSSKNHYTNSAAVMATKFDVVTDSGKVSLKDTLGARFVSGITPDVLNGGDSAIAQAGKNVSTAFSASQDDLIKQGEKYTLTLKKTNTGYHAIINNDETNEKIMYNPEKLLQLDSEKVYVGFAVARGCNVTVSDISMTTTDPATDPEAVPEPEEFGKLTTKIHSPSHTGSAEYPFVFTANLPGQLTVQDASGQVLVDHERVEQGKDYTKVLDLNVGANHYTVTFLPDEDSRTEDGLRIESYEPVTMNHSVTLKGFEASTIYVSPQGTSEGKGTEDAPVDIDTATKYVRAGQTIILAGGTYEMKAPLNIARGVDGTETNRITMRSEEGARAVLNFKDAGGGMQLWGSYWHIVGIDVCETPGNVKGLQVAGHNNIIEEVNTYRNGDTGLQISGASTEGFDKWPSHNLILNCTSYDNCDPGMNNADGFAAKITCGEGNIFRGCAAYNNLDDGWDLFAKIESGPIGAVVIEDSIAFNNGTLTNGEGQGDGNGFKLGGDGISVAHVLRNSISFNNNTNGITSNSNPAAIIENNTAYGNKGANITLYGKGSGDRKFVAKNNISMAGGAADNYSEMPSLASENNYFYNGSKSVNSVGQELTDKIFNSTEVANYTLKRHADGSIDMGSLLQLNDLAPAGIGARLEGEQLAPALERTWNFGQGDFVKETIEGKKVVIEEIVIDATNGKFNAVGRKNAQINPGTILRIPVNGPSEITFKHGYDAGEMTFTDEAGNVVNHTYNASGWVTETVVLEEATEGYITMEWEAGSKFYLESLTVKPTVSQKTTIQVGPSHTYKTVQSALDSIDYTPTEKSRVTIEIEPGTYVEEVTVTKPYVTFKNADPSQEVKITYDKASGHDSDSSKNFGTQQSASVTIAATAEGFEAYDIVFENSYNLNQPNLGDDPSARKQTQAVAVVTLADRIIFENCKFIGRQDTLYLKGSSKGQNSPEVNECRVYLKDCYIEGTVDFIFGDSVAVFDNCQLHMAYYTNGGHYTAANTNLATLGYIFNNCNLTIDEAYAPYIDPATGQFKIDEKTGKPVKNIDLGRPWQGDHTYPYFGSQTVFNNCKMDKAIAANGWSVWDSNTVTNKIRYMEYNSMDLEGNPLDLSKRPEWVRILEQDQASAYDTVNVLWGSDGWNPSGGETSAVNKVADITLDQYKVELPKGENITLTAQVLPVQGTNKDFTWQSSDPSIATVDEKGVVTAVGEGTVIITATTVENNCSVSAEVKVLPSRTKVPTVKEIKIEGPETVLPGDTLEGVYSYELESDNAFDNAKVQWYVVDPETGDEILVQEGTEAFDRTYKVTPGDIGYQIRFAVIPETITTYGDLGEIVKSPATAIVAKPDYEVPELYVREPFTSFLNKYEQVTKVTDASEAEWIGTNVAKGGITDRTGLTLLHTGEKASTGKMAWEIIDTSGRPSDDAEYNGNAAVSANIEYQNDASVLIYNAKEEWSNYTANARVRFSPLATGFSSASYWDMYIAYNPETNSGYKTRITRGSNTSSAVVTLYKVVNGVETKLAVDDQTLSNKLKQNAGEENPFFRVEMSNDGGTITSTLYFEGTEEDKVTLSFVDPEPLAGTVAFESFGKSGCPVIDMLTVEEILQEKPEEKPEDKPEEKPENKPEEDDDDDYFQTSSTPLKPALPAIEKQISDALAVQEVPNVSVDANGVVNINENSMQALIEANSDLRITVDTDTQLLLPALTLKAQGKHEVKVSAVAPSKAELEQIKALQKTDEKVTGVLVDQLTVTLGINAETKVESFQEPVRIEWKVAKDQVKDVNALTAVRYDKAADGTLKVVRLGGTYDEKTGIYSFLTNQVGTFGLVEAEDLMKVTLQVGSHNATVNGQKVVNDVAPEIVQDRMMLPVRFIAECLGAKVDWKFGRVTITLEEQARSFKVGEELVDYGVKPYIKGDRTYISARWIAEELGANVLWIPSTQTVEIVK